MTEVATVGEGPKPVQCLNCNRYNDRALRCRHCKKPLVTHCGPCEIEVQPATTVRCPRCNSRLWQAKKPMNQLLMAAIFIVVIGAIAGTCAAMSHFGGSDKRDCLERGEAYYREIGSWPILHSTGRRAVDEIEERCSNFSGAF